MSGTGFKDLQGWQLARMALHGLSERNPLLDLDTVDRVVYGNVIQEVQRLATAALVVVVMVVVVMMAAQRWDSDVRRRSAGVRGR